MLESNPRGLTIPLGKQSLIKPLMVGFLLLSELIQGGFYLAGFLSFPAGKVIQDV